MEPEVEIVEMFKNRTQKKNFPTSKPYKTGKCKQSQENLIHSADSLSVSECEDCTEDPPTHDDDGGDNVTSFILNKFFENSQNDTVVNRPIPKPRQKINQRRSSLTSQKTFYITSPKMVKNVQETSQSSSNKTYNVQHEAGEIEIHNEITNTRISISVHSQCDKYIEKGDTETLSDDHISNISENDDILALEHKQIDAEYIEMVELSKPAIENVQMAEDDVIVNKQYTYKNIVELIIHKCDRLKIDSLVLHPLVKVHLVDAKTGEYINKSDKSRSVVFFYENKDCDYISPVMTHAFNLQDNRTLVPAWEERIILNEDYNYFVDESHRIMAFFEILDFLTFSNTTQHKSAGWHKIAFAFLKIQGKDKSLNVGRKLRLQLYCHSHETKKENPLKCSVWEIWKKKTLKKYPSTLYVTIKSLISPTEIVEVLRSKTPIQREMGLKDCIINIEDDDRREALEHSTDLDKVLVSKNKVQWSRLPREICKLPNKCMTKFRSYDEGCFCMRFSSRGEYLACAIHMSETYSLVIYSILDLTEIFTFPCHQGLIYDIKWSHDDSLIITASADNTVSIFSFKNCNFIQILPHPSFVYSCDIYNNEVIASGCYDNIVRMWKNGKDGKVDFTLFEELEGHNGYVTSICFDKNRRLFSSDSVGIIIEWLEDKNKWILNRMIEILEIKNIVINSITLLPKQRKLLCHPRDCTIKVIDIKSGCILQCLQGLINKRVQMYVTISPCGTYVFSGSENGFVHAWNIINGEQLAIYTPYPTSGSNATIHCVQFHPLDNILAISHYGENLPILLYMFDDKAKSKDVDLKLITRRNEDLKQQGNNLLNTEGAKKINKLRKITLKRPTPNEKLNTKSILQKMDKIINC